MPRRRTPAAPPAAKRKGASRRADIPKAVLARLNAGLEETVTLVEWLAIDVRPLAAAAVRAAGLAQGSAAGHAILGASDRLATAPVTQRMKGMGSAVHEALATLAARGRARAFEGLAGHASDMVRGWAAYALGADRTLDLPRRLEGMRRFAADRAMSTRECAWDAWRPHVVADLERGIALLAPWVRDPDANVRRCAVEGTRPRGVWTAHVEALKADPAPGLPLLEPVRSDPSDYVRRSVANWLNDASKSRAAWVREVTARWLRESGTAETAWTVHHALRSLRATRA